MQLKRKAKLPTVIGFKTLPWAQNDNCRILFASAHKVCTFDLKEIPLFIRVTVVTYVNAILGNSYVILNLNVGKAFVIPR